MSDFLDDWLNKPKPKDPSKLSRRTVRSDRWDEEDFEAILESMPDFDTARDRICDRVDTGNALTADTFFSLYKVEPDMIPPAEVRPDYLIDGIVIDELRGMNEFEELRALGTIGDQVNAALGFITMRPDIEAIYDKTKKEQDLAKKLQEEMEQQAALESEASDIDQMLEDMEAEIQELEELTKAAEEGDEEAQAKLDDLQAKAKQARADQKANQKAQAKIAKSIGKNGQALADGIKSKMPSIQSHLQHGLQQAADEARDMMAMGEAWGMDAGQLQKLPAQERMELARKIQDKPNLKKLAQMIGPMKRLIFTEQMRKTDHAVDEIHSIELGDDLDRIVDDELLALRHPLLKQEFYKDVIDGTLLQYKLTGKEKIGLGSMIVDIDGSGSMAGDGECWAKAVGGGLMALARKQNRSFTGSHFGSGVRYPHSLRAEHSTYSADDAEIEEYYFPDKESYTPDMVLEFFELFFNGGTDFEAPLSRALECLQQEHAREGKVKGDIVFITDGLCGVSDEWLEMFMAEKERLMFQVFGVVIGGWQSSPEPLNTICEGKIVTVHDLLSGDEMRGVFQAIHAP